MTNIAGGNVTLNKAGAKVNVTKKSALIAVPTPKPKKDSVPVKAHSIEQALEKLSNKFEVTLRKTDGTSCAEEVSINDLEDFEEHQIIEKSTTLSSLKRQMEFLFEFQYELQNNPTLVAEMTELLRGEKKNQLISFLSNLQLEMKSGSSEFISFLKRS